jgi:hypothetical protein
MRLTREYFCRTTTRIRFGRKASAHGASGAKDARHRCGRCSTSDAVRRRRIWKCVRLDRQREDPQIEAAAQQKAV